MSPHALQHNSAIVDLLVQIKIATKVSMPDPCVRLIPCVAIACRHTAKRLMVTHVILTTLPLQDLLDLTHPISLSLTREIHMLQQASVKKTCNQQFQPINVGHPIMFPLSQTEDLEVGNTNLFCKPLKTTNSNISPTSTTSNSSNTVRTSMQIVKNSHLRWQPLCRKWVETKFLASRSNFSFSTFVLYLL